jgi:hypothetical protein
MAGVFSEATKKGRDKAACVELNQIDCSASFSAAEKAD